METARGILAKIWRRSSLYPMVDMDKITIQEAREAMELYAIEVLKEIENNIDSEYTKWDIQFEIKQKIKELTEQLNP